MPSSLSTFGLMALFLLMPEMASTTEVSQQDDSRVFTRPLQQFNPERSPRIPDLTAIEDSYIVALRESQRNRNKVSASATNNHHQPHHQENHHQHHHDEKLQHHHEEKHHHHHHEEHHHTDSHHDCKNGQHHLIQVPTTYEYVSTRPLTAMEKNYLRPHRPQPTEQKTVQNPQVDEAQQLQQQPTILDVSYEEPSEEVMETSASKEIVKLAPRPYFSVSDANSLYSTYSSNTVPVVNKKPPLITRTVSDVNAMYSAFSSNTAQVVDRKPPSIKKTFETRTETTTIKTSESNSEKPQEIQKPIKKTHLIKMPDVVGVMTNRAANVVRNGMKTVGSTIGIPMRNTLVGTLNTAMLPIVAAFSVGRRKRSIPAERQEVKGWKNIIQKASVRTLGYVEFLAKLMNKPLQSAVNINKLSNSSKRPLWLQFTRSTNNPTDSIENNATKVHSTVKRSTNSKIKNLKATNLKNMIPWLYPAFYRNKNTKIASRMTDVDIVDKGNFLGELEENVDPLTSASAPLVDRSSGEFDEYESEENETQLEQNAEEHTLSGEEEDENSTLMPESSSEFSDSLENQSGETDQLKGDEHETGDLLKYTHGHGIIVPPKKVSNSDETLKYTHGHGIIVPSKIENNFNNDDITKYTHGHGIIVPNPPSEDSAALTGVSSLVSDTVNNQNILTGFLNNNFSSVASDGIYITTGIFEDELDMALDDLESLMSDIFIAPLPGVEAVVAEDNDAVIIESAADPNKPDSVPVVSNLANIFITSSDTSSSSSSSSSSGSGVATSTTGVTSDPFASLYTLGLAAIGIFVLSLPIWVPIVAARMKKRWKKTILYRSQSLDRFKEFNPFSVLMRNLIASDSEEAFSDPGPLSSEEVYGPAIANFVDRRRRRRSINGNPFQHKR